MADMYRVRTALLWVSFLLSTPAFAGPPPSSAPSSGPMGRAEADETPTEVDPLGHPEREDRPHVSGDPRLIARLRPLLDAPALRGAKTSFLVTRLDSERPLIGLAEDMALHPASNTKLVTTAAALDVLGPHHVFRSELITARFKHGVAQGIYLVGGGNPRLVSESVWKLVDDAKRFGLKKIEGDLVVDNTRFTSRTMAPGYNDKKQDAAYRAAVGATSVNFNAVLIDVAPGPVGKKAKVTLRPGGGYVHLVNKTRMIRKGRSGVRVSAVAYKGRTRITVSGKMKVTDGHIVTRRRIDNPALFAGYALKRALRDAGIKFKGRVLIGKLPRKPKRLSHVDSPALARMIHDVNKHSNNFMAEMLLLNMAHEKTGTGDWRGGQKVVRRFLKRAGVHGAYTYENGSGLFGKTRFSAQQLVTVLRFMANRRPALPEYRASLPIAGADGTLKRRMKHLALGVIRAKTGTLNGVVCISGYVTFADGTEGAFSLLTNKAHASGRQVARAHSAILESLAGYAPPVRLPHRD